MYVVLIAVRSGEKWRIKNMKKNEYQTDFRVQFQAVAHSEVSDLVICSHFIKFLFEPAKEAMKKTMQ